MRYDGEIRYATIPRLTRPSEMQKQALVALQRFAQTRKAAEMERNEDNDGRGNILDAVLSLAAGEDDLEPDDEHVVEALLDLLPADGMGGRCATALNRWLEEQGPDDPHEVGARILYERRPVFVLFGDEERALASDYQLPHVADETPAALDNLSRLASLDLSALQEAVRIQDVGMVETLTEHANARLRDVFAEAWSQDPVHVRVKQDGQTFRVLVSTREGGYSSIAERSDGLKTFVALTAFAARHRIPDRSLILMIDEAEQHLHYDAQADLVRMLDRQTVAQQVLYTTHSGGCLPADMGTGIRPVVQVGDESGFSRIANTFWEEKPGFTPMLMAMGAAAAAFTPARYAVLAEGVTEMLLFPTLVREATGRDQLDYQVAPGISGRSVRELRDLDLEAARVVYLVDGDAGGTEHGKRLSAAGVQESMIVTLGGTGSGVCLEEVLLLEPFLRALNEALVRRYGSGHTMKATELPSGIPRYQSIKAWSRKRGIEPVSKTAIVAAVLEHPAGRLLSAEGRKHVKRAHQQICRALDIPA